YTASDHSVKTYFEEVGFLPEVMFEVREELVLLLGLSKKVIIYYPTVNTRFSFSIRDKWSAATFSIPFLSLISISNSSESLDDMITGRKDGSSRNTYSKLSGRGLSSRSVGDSEFSLAVIAMNSSNSEKISSSRGFLQWNGRFCSLQSILKIICSVPTPRLICLRLTRITASTVQRKGHPKMMGTLLSSSISRITKSAGKVNLPTSMSIFSAIPIGYWNDLSANLTLILVGLRVSRDNFAYKEYGIRLMLAPRSAKALQEKILLKLHGIRKLPGSLSFGGTLFWIIAELHRLGKWQKFA
ncbi:hypothetical protein Tco_0580294, partial [Tanacetum coccineum]